MNLDPDDVRARIDARTRAVVAVHFMGYAAEVEALRTLCDERRLRLIEDTAQAIGARTRSGRMAGTVGDLGCFSLFSKKQLCVGEGGMVVTSDRGPGLESPAPALARDDLGHMGSSPGLRRDL